MPAAGCGRCANWFAGVIYSDLAMMAGVSTTCEECEGKRFQAAVLEHKLGGRDISEVLAMPVAEAQEFFGSGEARTPAARAILGCHRNTAETGRRTAGPLLSTGPAPRRQWSGRS
ncbi:hypothetical protein AB0L30_36355 [Microbispora rosea]